MSASPEMPVSMSEGSPSLILERGENAVLPPALWVMATQDEVHNYHDPESEMPRSEADRFIHRYKEASGAIELVVYDAPMMFTTMHPTLPDSVSAMQKVVEFAQRHLGN